jgi:hypothetical protein
VCADKFALLDTLSVQINMLTWLFSLQSVLAIHAPMLRGTARLIRSLVLRWVGMPLLVLVLEVSVL